MEIYQKSLQCLFCKKTFEKRNILKRHLREKHFCGNVYKCNMCTVSFVRKERLIRHLKSVHFDLKYHCQECNMKFVEKYKHNYHMVHHHGYSYCSNCKISYRTYKQIGKKKTQSVKSEYKNEENEHICKNYTLFYKCFKSNCKGKKIYNRLNFFIRHLQLEHNIKDFKEVKEIIDQNTYETKQTNRKSRIRAKTLEGHSEDLISEDLRELWDYAKKKCGKKPKKEKTMSAQEILNKLGAGNEKKVKEEEEESYDEMKVETRLQKVKKIKKNNEQDEKFLYNYKGECLGEISLKDLMQNINIMCMMENNQKKYFNNSFPDDEVISANIDCDDIVLGKRGRPSKKVKNGQTSLSETVVGSYLTKFEDKTKIKKSVIKRSNIQLVDKQKSTKKIKEKKKIKPVYFDDILMETLNITKKVFNNKNIFHIHRKSIFFILNDRIWTRKEELPFAPQEEVFIKLDINSEEDIMFEDLIKNKKLKILEKKQKLEIKKKGKIEKKLEIKYEKKIEKKIQKNNDKKYNKQINKQNQKKFDINDEKDKDKSLNKVKTYQCEDCEKEFFNVLGYKQHKNTIHGTCC